MFTIDVVTLFPELFAPFVGLSIVGRAVESGVVSVRYHHLLDELGDGERADDAPVRRRRRDGAADRADRARPRPDRGGGARRRAARDRRAEPERPPVRAARGARAGRSSDRLVIVCGHYEGIDDRLGRLYPVEEWSLGDFVLTGGEIPALAFMDATVRLLPGAVRPESLESESFAAGMLDYPSFTRPATLSRRGGAARSSSREITPRSRSGAASNRGCARRPAGGTCSTTPCTATEGP